mmetsp:Transcript_7328/g.18179  ORF Transcript_7328/g.18179 Transcript_7328/m.18179 type:complete len:249 (-) Transcript_7328:505-1251(-)
MCALAPGVSQSNSSSASQCSRFSSSSLKSGANADQHSVYCCAHTYARPLDASDTRHARAGCHSTAHTPSLGPSRMRSMLPYSADHTYMTCCVLLAMAATTCSPSALNAASPHIMRSTALANSRTGVSTALAGVSAHSREPGLAALTSTPASRVLASSALTAVQLPASARAAATSYRRTARSLQLASRCVPLRLKRSPVTRALLGTLTTSITASVCASSTVSSPPLGWPTTTRSPPGVNAARMGGADLG